MRSGRKLVKVLLRRRPFRRPGRFPRSRHTALTCGPAGRTMCLMRYVVTGGTGFIGRRVVSRLLDNRPDAEVWVLVRRSSLGRLEKLAEQWGDRAKPLVGELTEPSLGLTDEAVTELGDVDHLVHCAAIYDITAAEAEQRAANVDGTRAVIDLARRLDATLHHVSSIALARDFQGESKKADLHIRQHA